MSITITWHGHSCFSVSADGYSIVLDPYAPDSVPGLPPLSLSASQVLCSHGHSDHGYTDAVGLSAGKQGVAFRAKCKMFSRHLQKPILKTEKGRFKGL